MATTRPREVTLQPGWLAKDMSRAAIAERERRNLNPHAEAIAAIHIWGAEYSQQRLGCMDWWDSLPDAKKRLVRGLLDRVASLPRERVPES